MTIAPVALFVYNRPLHTRRTVETLLGSAEAARTPLYVFSDAPKNAEANGAVADVRTYIRSIAGFKSVTIVDQKANLGLARSITSGVTSLCEEFGRAIVVEDDLLLSPRFLEYMNVSIEKYKDDAQVMQISAHMFPVEVDARHDAFFLPFISSWGWATWGRAWRKFDPFAKGYALLKTDVSRRKAFNMNGAYDYFSMLEAQLKSNVDSWAILWNLSVFMNEGLVLYPRKSLVENKGFDGSGIHCRGEAPDQVVDADYIPRVLPSPVIDPEVRELVFSYFRARRSPSARLRAMAARYLG